MTNEGFEFHEDIGESPGWTEYSLPISARIRPQIECRWLEEVAGSTPGEALRLLEQRWAEASDGPLRMICDAMLQFTPKSVAEVEGNVALICVKNETNDKWKEGFVLPGRDERELIRQNLDRSGINTPLFEDLLFLLGGLRRGVSRGGGYFISGASKFFSFEEFYLVEPDKYGQWRGSIAFYTSCAGDVLILHPSGRVGWVDGETTDILKYADSFEELLEKYYCLRHHDLFIIRSCIGEGAKVGNKSFGDWLT